MMSLNFWYIAIVATPFENEFNTFMENIYKISPIPEEELSVHPYLKTPCV